MPLPPVVLRSVQVVGAIWASPATAIGLVAGAASLAWGARLRWSTPDLALVFQKFPWGTGGAITFGNVILHTGEHLDCPCRTYAHAAGLRQENRIVMAHHERAHVYQYMVLGVLFLPLYLLCGGVSYRNRFEQAADRYALTGQGWWPWSR